VPRRRARRTLHEHDADNDFNFAIENDARIDELAETYALKNVADAIALVTDWRRDNAHRKPTLAPNLDDAGFDHSDLGPAITAVSLRCAPGPSHDSTVRRRGRPFCASCSPPNGRRGRAENRSDAGCFV
jgi:hypothetical protein